MPQFLHSLNERQRGLLCGLVGGLALSVDIPLIRLAGTDLWTVLAVRGAIMFLSLFAVWAVLRRMQIIQHGFISGWPGFIASVLQAGGNLFFVTGIFYATTANLVFIVASSALMTLLLSWLVLKEQPSLRNWIAVSAAMVGVSIIVGGGFQSNSPGEVYGILAAIGAAICIASYLVIARRYRNYNFAFTPAIGALISGVFALPMMVLYGEGIAQPFYLFLDAALLMPIALGLLAFAPRLVPAPQVALFYMLETVLAPIYVWVLFNEELTVFTLIGGAIVLGAIAYNGMGRRRAVV